MSQNTTSHQHPNPPIQEYFDFEQLDVYYLAVEHLELVTRVRATAKVLDQLDRASESILLNIAEGMGKPVRSKDRRKYFRTALGSAKESACAWTILRIRKHAEDPLPSDARSILLRVVAMLTKMTG